MGDDQNQAADPSRRSAKQAFRGNLSLAYRLARKQGWWNPLLWAMLIGLAATLLLACRQQQPSRVIAETLFVALSASAVGALLGFLFGIPRTLSASESRPAQGSLFQQPTNAPNTNLEQVSDWITKIIIALGLAQLGKIPGLYEGLAQYTAGAVSGNAVTPSLAALMLAYFLVLGFLSTYLWTRLFLSGQFNRVDSQAQQSPEFLEGLIQALLYQPPPAGYEKALELSQQYRSAYGNDNWRIWRSIACAYGQQYANLSAADRSGTTGQNAREQALNAVREVLRLNPQEKQSLVALWDPAKATPQEDDLTVFYADPQFRTLLL